MSAVPTERLRAMIRLLSPDEMTPTAKRQLELICDEADIEQPLGRDAEPFHDWTPKEGDFAQRHNVHIVARVKDDRRGWLVTMACGLVWSSVVLKHVGGDTGRPCIACWETF